MLLSQLHLALWLCILPIGRAKAVLVFPTVEALQVGVLAMVVLQAGLMVLQVDWAVVPLVAVPVDPEAVVREDLAAEALVAQDGREAVLEAPDIQAALVVLVALGVLEALVVVPLVLLVEAILRLLFLTHVNKRTMSLLLENIWVALHSSGVLDTSLVKSIPQAIMSLAKELLSGQSFWLQLLISSSSSIPMLNMV